jgi:hypothetical protein
MKGKLPGEKTMNNAFMEKGLRNVVMIDVFEINDGDLLTLTFESTNSPWRQGIWLKTNEHLLINQVQCPSAQIWQDTAPKEVFIECHTSDKRLQLYNIWDRGNGQESQSWTSGMLVEELPNGRRYHCNDIGFDTDFAKLIFRIERLKH